MTDSHDELLIHSPAGAVAERASVKRAARRLKALGFHVQVDADATARHQRFAGDDDTRLATLHRVADAAPSVALATRGGYGITRLLDRIDWKRIARSVERGTRWVGYSDLTALQLAALAHGAGGSDQHAHCDHAHAGHDHHHTHGGFWAGPMACGDFGLEGVDGGGDDVTQDIFCEAMGGELEAIGFRTEAGFDGLQAKGRLWGGNLTVLMSLLGTPHAPRIRGGVLFLEDVNEHPYRIERSLLQLHQAGVLDAQKAVLLGEFTDWKKSPLDRGYKLKSAIEHLRSVTRTPILTGLPYGHTPVKVCLPQGQKVQLVVEGRDAMVLW
ncbi:MAG: LD-carboxypeptidase [Aquabacterium sp.]|jgi:muramoyltetrapeptide carboxypeptidase|nr:MAG: LD-carboxypeptidase [Aquabacterium sp.]